MAILKITQTRLTEDVIFFKWPLATNEYLFDNYIQTGKIIGDIANTVSENKLIQTTIFAFRTNEDLTEFKQDINLNQIRIEKQEYDVLHNIITDDKTIRD